MLSMHLLITSLEDIFGPSSKTYIINTPYLGALLVTSILLLALMKIEETSIPQEFPWKNFSTGQIPTIYFTSLQEEFSSLGQMAEEEQDVLKGG